MSKKTETIEKLVEAVAEPVAQEMGFVLVGVEYAPKNEEDNELVIYIDKPEGGIDLDECENFSRAVDPLIDEKDPIEEAYVLCVSSPGLERTIKTDREFTWAMGKTVDVKLYKKDDAGNKLYTGMLKDKSEQMLTIIAGEEEKTFEFKQVALVKLHLDF